MQIEGCKSGARSITKPGAVGNLHAARPASEDGNVFKLFGLQHFVAEDVYLFFLHGYDMVMTFMTQTCIDLIWDGLAGIYFT